MTEPEYIRPADIERRSMEIIESELGETPWLDEREHAILKRVVHTTADFDFVKNLTFSKNAVKSAIDALKAGAVIVTDTNMALSGINKRALSALGGAAYCFAADDDVAAAARENGTTRAVAAMDKAAEVFRGKDVIFAIGNAPTALMRLCGLISSGAVSPALVIAAPVGFVNVERSKELAQKCCAPLIAAMGRKGGSAVAAAACNALLYMVYDRGE